MIDAGLNFIFAPGPRGVIISRADIALYEPIEPLPEIVRSIQATSITDVVIEYLLLLPLLLPPTRPQCRPLHTIHVAFRPSILDAGLHGYIKRCCCYYLITIKIYIAIIRDRKLYYRMRTVRRPPVPPSVFAAATFLFHRVGKTEEECLLTP